MQRKSVAWRDMMAALSADALADVALHEYFHLQSVGHLCSEAEQHLHEGKIRETNGRRENCEIH